MITRCKKKIIVHCKDVQAVFGFGLMIKILNKLLKVTQSTESTSQTLTAWTLMAGVNPSIHLLYEDRCLYQSRCLEKPMGCWSVSGLEVPAKWSYPLLPHICCNLSKSRDFKGNVKPEVKKFYYLLPKNYFYSVLQYLLLSLPVLYDCHTNGKDPFSNLDS